MNIHKANHNQKNIQRSAALKHARLFHILSLLTMLSLIIIPSSGFAKKKEGNVYKEKYAAFVMDSDTGLILHRENANKPLHPASLTKMMTLLMVFDALERKKLKLYSRVRISKHAASMVPSKLDLPVGSTIKVEDAIYSLVTKSANDVAVALAEKLGGTESNFARMMNKKARKIGMTRTRFKNASGLHDPKQVSTARDMARLARVIINDYGKYYHYFSTKKFTYQGKTYKNHNKLMHTYAGMDGMKTGYIRPSGFNLVASAVQNDRRLIAVVFGGRTGKLRNAQMKKLLDQSFQRINNLTIASNNVPTPQKKPIRAIELASMETHIATPPILKNIDIKPQHKKSRWDMLDSSSPDSMFSRMIGEGDYDITVRNRIETGLIAISAHLKETNTDITNDNDKIFKLASVNSSKMPAPTPPMKELSKKGVWAIQIGAFTTRERTDKAIITSLGKLPSDLKHASASIAPLKTPQGWIYRGRLQGYTKTAANDACRILSDCIPVSPNAQ